MNKPASMWLLTLTLFVFLASGARSVAARQESTLPNLEVVIVLDDSNSMWTSTDQEDWRAEAVELFVNGLGVDLSASNYRLAIVTFDDAAHLVGSGFADLDDLAARTTLLSDFNADRFNRNGWTNVLAGLEASRGLFQTHSADYKPIVVLLTDGQPETAAANSAQSPEQLATYVAQVEQLATTGFRNLTYDGPRCGTTLGAPIYTIAIRAAAAVGSYRPEDRALWQRISSQTGGGYYEILPTSTADFQKALQQTFTNLQREMLCAQVADTEYFPVTELVTRPFTVDAIHESVIFTVSKTNPNIAVTIRDAAGQVVGATGQDISVYETEHSLSSEQLSESWGFRRPADGTGWAGNWVVELVGTAATDSDVEARVSSLYVPEAFTLDIVQPEGSFLPVGGQVVLEMQLSGDTTGISIDGLPETSIICDNGQEFTPLDTWISGNVVHGIFDFSGAAPGKCRLDTSAEIASDASGSFSIPRLKDFDAVELPRADILSPAHNAGFSADAPPELVARLMVGAADYASVGADEVSATLYNAEDHVVANYTLQRDPDQPGAIYTAALDGPTEPGDYRLRLVFRARPPGSIDFLPPYYNETRFTINSPATPTATAIVAAPVAEIVTVMPTATAVPPPPPAPSEVPTWLFGLCAVLLLLAGVVLFFLLRGGRQAVAVASLTDLSGAGNDQDLRAGRGSLKVQLVDAVGEPLATLVVHANSEGGHRVKVAKVADGVIVTHVGVEYLPDMEFTPHHNDIIGVGNVQLRYEVDQLPEDEAQSSYTQRA